MRKTTTRAAALLGALGLLAASAAARADTLLLKLRDGRILWGSVEGHTSEELALRRLDTGGRVELPWDMIDPAQNREMRVAYGYIEPEGDEILVSVDLIPIVDGTELVGKIEGRTDRYLIVKHAGGRMQLPLARVSGPSRKVQVPALEIYTREELYKLRVDELGPGLLGTGPEAADLHFELAAFCERILDFQGALRHYAIGAELAPEHRADEVAAAVERLEEKARHQEQWSYLEEADRLRARRLYARSIAMLEAFPEVYPDSPVRSDWERLLARARKAQERAVREDVVRRWHHWVERHARTAARELGYEGVMDFVDSEMGERVAESVHADLLEEMPELSVEVVRALWEERPRTSRLQRASYGHGTWLLGEERARARPTDDEEEEAEPRTEAQRARQELEERMRRYVEAQRSSARRQSASERDDPELFWKTFSMNARRQWITAYYAEFSGDMEVVRVRLSNCAECAGTGAREILYLGSAKTREEGSRTSSGGTRLEECPTCHGVGVVRRLQYR